MICAGNDGLFRKFAMLLDHPEWGSDERYKTNNARKNHEVELIEQISAIIATRTAEEWLIKLAGAGVPAGRVNNIAQALEQDQIVARETVETLKHKVAGDVKLMKNPMRFSNLGIESTLAPPTLGEHTDSVYKELLGLSEQELSELKTINVI